MTMKTLVAIAALAYAGFSLATGGQISGEMASDGKNHDAYAIFTSKTLANDPGKDHIDCPPEGRFKKKTSAAQLAKLKKLNRDKNRYLPPTGPYQTIALSDLVASGADGRDFASAGPGEIVGYVRQVKPGEPETCNAYSTATIEKDTHIELVPALADAKMQDKKATRKLGKEKIVVVEVTPRVRSIALAQGLDWSSGNLERLEKDHSLIKVRGYMFNDSEHKAMSFASHPNTPVLPSVKRGTCWEIHPVTAIHVLVEKPVQ